MHRVARLCRLSNRPGLLQLDKFLDCTKTNGYKSCTSRCLTTTVSGSSRGLSTDTGRERPDLPVGAQVVIAGGGVIGTSVAYHLALNGWTDVVLLEQGR